jgi:hypothetical protein
MDLSPRETEILTKLRSTNSRKLVATELRISISRVYNAVSRVRAKRNEAITFLKKVRPFKPILEHQRSTIPDREVSDEDLEEGTPEGPETGAAQVRKKAKKRKSHRRKTRRLRKRARRKR